MLIGKNNGDKMINRVELVKYKEKCCGCEACVNVCPHNAITLEYDKFGFLFPKIDDSKCTRCGLCKKECSYQNDVECFFKNSQEVYAAQNKNLEIIKKSASGGIFSGIAREFLKNGGIVYGVTQEYRNGNINIFHTRADCVEKLESLQGSKYVQSRMLNIYKEIKDDVKNNRMVLFSGTPCQVAAVKKFFERDVKKENIYYIDIICHGVPSQKIFQEYIRLKEKKNKKIIDFKFRDKSLGWLGYKGKILYENTYGEKKEKNVNSKFSSFYNLFLGNILSRDSCYSCKYAQNKRVGDITIGDFWGIDKCQPELLMENGGMLNQHNGVSCVLVNSNKGKKIIESYGNEIIKEPSNLYNACKYNEQLNKPSRCNKNRNLYLHKYEMNGYKGIERLFIKKVLIRSCVNKILGRKK